MHLNMSMPLYIYGSFGYTYSFNAINYESCASLFVYLVMMVNFVEFACICLFNVFSCACLCNVFDFTSFHCSFS